ncbi:hypothetical protein IW262DRAFT_499533 [Armillaria fumosa]|nr:hypothetical protein IW262DRAFT_499533 [Armillaria fumosa]
MDASPSSLNPATHAPISGGNMAENYEEQAGCPSVVYSQLIDYDWESIDLSSFESFCAQVLGCEESLPHQRSRSIPDPDCFIMDDDLQISSSPLPSFIELGPEWTCRETAATASPDPSNEGDNCPTTTLTHAVVEDQCPGGNRNAKLDNPDRCLSLSVPPLQVEPSAWYPTPRRSLPPPSAISPADTYAPARQLSPLAGSSTSTSYPGVFNVPSPLTHNPYRALTFHGVETPSTLSSSSKQYVESMIASFTSRL